MVEGVAHTLSEERRLQPATAQVWNRGGTAEQRNPLMDAQHAGGAGFAVDLGEEAQTLLAGCRDGTDLLQKVQKFRMFVGPGLSADVRPQLRLCRPDTAHPDVGVVFRRGRFDGPRKNVADLDGPVVAPAQQVQRSDARERTHLEKHRRSAVEKEALDRIELRQISTLTAIEESYDNKAKRMRSVLTDLGVDPGKAPGAPGAIGGPFVPVTLTAEAGAFERQLYRINIARAHVERLTRTLGAVPVRKPIIGEIDLSSGFGVRMDPFVRAMAMHTGIDFRSSTGDPVRVTANGTVTSAGWSGGYGKMVEVDHGNGFSTRYGHMSEISVKAGQTVRIGQTLGRVGSTGRSTGPHLHYETRIDGEAIDPQKFLRAGIRLGNSL